jgi:hypothetical protein
MDVIKLRILTRKSLLKFGMYATLGVQQVIDLRHFRYLRWCYFNISGISFTDDILEEIHISEQYKIEKPGTDPDKCKEIGKILDKTDGS